jgi:hypothetical protein
MFRANAHWALAQARWAAGRREAAVRDARLALEHMRSLDGSYSSRADEIARWIARHD